MALTGMKHSMNTVFTLWLREMLRYRRSRSRIIGSLATPLFFLVIMGSALGSTMTMRNGSYIDYMAPGIIGMSVLFASLMGGVSIIWDREFGFLKEILVAPVSRFYTALGKAAGGVTAAMVQGTLLMIISGLFIVDYTSVMGQILSILIMFITGMGFIGLGITLASRIESHEGFQMMMTFITFPTLMASTAFYPMANLPSWLSIPVQLNPLTYGVEALRWALLGVSEIPIMRSMTVIIVFALTMILLGSWSFDRAGDH
ncbi:ABC transporter permease [Methanolobus sp.]|uniref:ABC transporter permease n=1 Tax=Methanolobus sp. TaxID=1874737 RepID=UPI0025F7296D|nr:ABC transporter permease [Methanolobus sp.]